MQIQLKKLGKKKIKIIEVTLEKQPETLRELISECVKSEVKRFNDSREDTSLIPFLSAQEIGEQAQEGKITFGDRKIEPWPTSPWPWTPLFLPLPMDSLLSL